MIGPTITMALAAVEAELAYRASRRGIGELERRHGGWAVILGAIGAVNGLGHLSASWIFG